MRWSFGVALISALGGTGCSEPGACPAWAFPAIQADVSSVVDGAPLLDALGEVTDGGYRDSLLPLGDGQYGAAYNRGGAYAVHVERPGYAPWDTSGIYVGEVGGECTTVNTEVVPVRLTPMP